MRIINRVGIYALYLLMVMVPLHFEVTKYSSLTFYRELFGLFFILLLISNLIDKRFLNVKMRYEIFFLLLFPLLLCISAIYDPMVNLYSNNWGLGVITSTYDSNLDPRLYVIRNAVLYLPMVLYFSIRGITKGELKNIALVSIIIAPLSILLYLLSVYESGEFSLFLLGDMAEAGGANIAYNSYVPYLTFPFISAIYILFTKSSFLEKNIGVFSISIMIIFMFLSSSRQSVLLIAFSLLVFSSFDKSGMGRKFIGYSIVVLVVSIIYYYITVDVELNQGLVDKYSSGGETSRFTILLHGLGLLRVEEFFIGAGLTSVVNSGPHNDYLRWTQRVGLLFMIISFTPYFIAFIRAALKALEETERVHLIYIALSIFYTLYHSLFGYPREDAFQALFCFLGLALWLGYQRNGDHVLKI